jgi:hypothetical protein
MKPAPYPDLSRRRFAIAVGGSSLLMLNACGGGGDGTPAPAPAPAPAPTPAPTPAPAPAPAAIALLAGGLGGSGALEGTGPAARLGRPSRLAAGADGTVYFVDGIWIGRVTPQGAASYLASVPDISIGGLAVDGQGRLYVTATGTAVIYRLKDGPQPFFEGVAGTMQPYPGGGFQDGTGSAAQLRLPRSIVFDGNGFLYFTESANRAVRRMTPDGVVTTIAGQPSNTTAVDGQGAAAGFVDPHGLAVMPDGNLLVLDNNRWRRVTPQGQVTTLPGTVPAIDPAAIAPAGPDSVYALLDGSLVRLRLDGTVTPLAAGVATGTDTLKGLALLPGNDVAVSDGSASVIRRFSPAGAVVSTTGAAPQPRRVDAAGADARFAAMGSVATDAAGNFYVIDTERKNVRKVTPAGAVTTLFADFPSEGGLAIDAAGNFYGVRDRAIYKVTPAGAQSLFAGRPGVLGFADGPAAEASFARPQGLAFDAAGNLFVGDGPQITQECCFRFDSTYTYGNTIRKITAAGQVSTFAGTPGRTYSYPSSTPIDLNGEYHAPKVLAFDGSGRLYVLDTRLGHIRRIEPQGGAPTQVAQGWITAMAVMLAGTVDFARVDSLNDVHHAITLRRVEAAGASRLLAGQEQRFRQGVQLGALPGAFNFVDAMAAAPGGALYVASENSVLRVLPA